MEKSKQKGQILQEPNLEQVGYLCRRVMQAALRDLATTVPDLDVTLGQMGTLVLIACNPGITPTDICRAQGHAKPTITASLDALERHELITRRPSRLDRRSFSLFLTPKGTALYNDIAPRVKESDRRLTKVLSEEERNQLIDLLMRIYANECIEVTEDSNAPVSFRATRKRKLNIDEVEDGRVGSRPGPVSPASTHVDVLRQLDRLERSSARLRRVVVDLAN